MDPILCIPTKSSSLVLISLCKRYLVKGCIACTCIRHIDLLLASFVIPQWNCVSINENKPKTGQVLATHTWARACMTGCFTGLSRYTLLTASFHHCIRIGSNPVSFTVSPTSPVSTLKHRMANNAALSSCVVGQDVKRATRCRQEVQANTYLFELQQPNVVIIVVCPAVKTRRYHAVRH